MNLSGMQVAKWANACLAMGDEVIDGDGFVPVRRLLSRFNAKLELRPLLVEAMLCESSDARDPACQSARWCLLVDSEKYPLTTAQIASECATSPLPARFRNTVAHELTHSLAFRAKEFGVDLTIPTSSGKGTSKEVVDEIERRTESLSPLLLAPDTAVDRCFPSTLKHLSIADLEKARRRLGVSRFVLVQRLNLMRSYGNPRFIERPCFYNVAVGIGAWTQGGEAVLKGWPLFAQFIGGERPSFIHSLSKTASLAATSLTDDVSFLLNGGDMSSVVVEATLGTEKTQGSISVPFNISVESTNRKARQSFFFLVQPNAASQTETREHNL